MPLLGTRRSVCGCLLLWAVGRISPKRTQDQLTVRLRTRQDPETKTDHICRKEVGEQKEVERKGVAGQDGKEVKPTELAHPLTVSPDDNIFSPPHSQTSKPS